MGSGAFAVSAATPPIDGWLPSLHLSVGGYDSRVVGMHMCTESDGLLSLEARFAYTGHAGSVRALALCDNILVSGSSDETIRAYDVSKRVEAAALVHHSGSVNTLAFVRDPISASTYLLSGADDASICLTRMSDWRLLKKLTGHTAPVLGIAVHPSSLVALSIAKDRSLFMWNMIKGKVAFSAKTKPGPASSVQWSSSGARYMITSKSVASLYSAEGQLEATFAHDSELLSATFLDENRIVTGGEDKVVSVWDVRTNAVVAEPARHDMRVRAVAAVAGVVISADTGGGLKVWDERRGNSPRLETYVGGAGMRLTTLAVSLDGATAQSEDTAEHNKVRHHRTAKRSLANETHRIATNTNTDESQNIEHTEETRPMPRGNSSTNTEMASPIKRSTASSRKREKRKARKTS